MRWRKNENALSRYIQRHQRDMFIGALIDLGADAHKLERELKKLKLGGYHLHVARQPKIRHRGREV